MSEINDTTVYNALSSDFSNAREASILNKKIAFDEYISSLSVNDYNTLSLSYFIPGKVILNSATEKQNNQIIDARYFVLDTTMNKIVFKPNIDYLMNEDVAIEKQALTLVKGVPDSIKGQVYVMYPMEELPDGMEYAHSLFNILLVKELYSAFVAVHLSLKYVEYPAAEEENSIHFFEDSHEKVVTSPTGKSMDQLFVYLKSSHDIFKHNEHLARFNKYGIICEHEGLLHLFLPKDK